MLLFDGEVIFLPGSVVQVWVLALKVTWCW